MTSGKGPAHVVVDGSNIATEGRSLPSLAQLNEAVMGFMEEYPDTAITVVVDATFGHRIDKKETKEFEEGISNNELVAPPAGAVGRGDAFVLAIAQKSKASILSNDSFQEFHGEYDWLFDEGRLIGGKPVPHVGWVFVNRSPVRGPVSRKATGGRGSNRRGSKSDGSGSGRDGGRGRSARTTSEAANQPMPVPKSPPPSRTASSGRSEAREETARTSAPKSGETVNELMPFLEFVEHHPVGTSVNGTVESYSSHGAYISIGENGVRGYVSLRLMADPAPTSARKVMKLGESVTLVVVSFAPLRRSIDCAVPDMAQAAIAAAKQQQEDAEADGGADAPEKPARGRRRTTAKSTPTEAAEDTGTPTTKPASTTAARNATAKKAPARKTNTKKVAAKKTPAKKTPAKKVPAKTTPTRKAAAKKTPAKKAPAKKATATKAPAKKAPAKQPSPKKPIAKKAAARKAPVKKATAKKAPAKKTPAKRAPAKKTPAKKAPAKKSAAKRGAAETATSANATDNR